MADDTRWQWDTRVRRYRDTKTGRFLAADRVNRLRDQFTAYRSTGMREFVADALDGVDRTDRDAWRAAVRQVETLGWKRVENTLIAEYMYGRGGINAMTEADTAKLRTYLRGQKRYWNGFMREAYADPEKMTTAYMQNRAELYQHAGTEFHERGRAAAWDIGLPTYPGQQACGSRCRCHWSIRESGDEVHATWTLGAADHCDDCVGNASRYDPYIITRTTEAGVYT